MSMAAKARDDCLTNYTFELMQIFFESKRKNGIRNRLIDKNDWEYASYLR